MIQYNFESLPLGMAIMTGRIRVSVCQISPVSSGALKVLVLYRHHIYLRETSLWGNKFEHSVFTTKQYSSFQMATFTADNLIYTSILSEHGSQILNNRIRSLPSCKMPTFIFILKYNWAQSLIPQLR
jgi:hypothetical protein